MRVAVTGGLGLIGSALAERFIALGEDVLVVDHAHGAVVKSDVITERGGEVTLQPVGQWVADNLSVRTARDLPNLVVHCAAPVGPGLVSTRGGEVAMDIIATTWSVARLCAAWDIPLVNLSSSEVYGVDQGSLEDSPVGHVGAFTARSEYGLAKLTAECLLANTRRLRHVSIRPFNTVGARQSASKGFVLPTFVEQAKANVPLTVYEPDAVRALTHVDDLVEFVVAQWPILVEHGGPVNVGNERNETTMAQLAQAVIDRHIAVTGSDGRWAKADPRERWGDTYAYFLGEGRSKTPDSTLARSLGFDPKRGLYQIVREAYLA